MSDDELDKVGVEKALHWCFMCEERAALYCCPACELRTCSVKCVRQHKQQYHCTGQRDKTKYIEAQSMNDLTLLNDYRLLESIGRVCDNAQRDSLARAPVNSFYEKKMMTKARQKGIQLFLLPKQFRIRRKNTTFFNQKLRVFFWYVELVFPAVNARFIEKKQHEETKLRTILCRYFSPISDDCTANQKLGTCYQDCGLDNVCVFMSDAPKEGDVKTCYIKLDINQSILANLKGKKVLEYPELYIVLPHEVAKYSKDS